MSQTSEQTPEINGMPLASVEPEARPFSQSVPEHTSGPQVVVERSRVKATRRSASVYPKGNAVALAYILKVPTREALFDVFSRYVLIRELVFTFDRQHEESWFEAYPQALRAALPNGAAFPTREELRANYRLYATMIAHYSYYYDVVYSMKGASLINLLTLSRFNGKTRRKDVATLTRWAFINRNTGDFIAYPQPTGKMNAMITAAKPASGSTSNGVSVLALPLYDTTVYGNLGNHAGSLKDQIVDIKPNADRDADEAFGYSTSIEEREFYANSARVAAQYYAAKSFDILNASTLVVDAEGNDGLAKSAYVSLQRDGRKRCYDLDPTQDTSLTRTAWNNYNFWSNVLAQQFPEMRDPAHDIVRLFKQLKFVEDSPAPEAVMNAVHGAAFYDITSLRNVMQYMKGGKANTSTIVRQSLPLTKVANSLNDASEALLKNAKAVNDASVHKTNFLRFDFSQDTAAEWIASAKRWPGLTPRCFPDADKRSGVPASQAAVVAGAISSDGSIAAVSEGFMNSGKYATYFDYATHQTLDPSKSLVELSAIGESTAREIVENREGFICAEDPSQLFVLQSKFIDVSDPFQCGFYLLSQVPDAAYSEIEQFLSEVGTVMGANVDPASTAVKSPARASILTATLDGVPISLSSARGDSKGNPKNTAYVFQTQDWYSLLFLGDMPFMIPQARSLLNSFASPFEASKAFKVSGGNPAPFTWRDAVKQKYDELSQIAAMEAVVISKVEGVYDSTTKGAIDTAVAKSTIFATSSPKDGETVDFEATAAQNKDTTSDIDPKKASFYLSRTPRTYDAAGKSFTHSQTDKYKLAFTKWEVNPDGNVKAEADITWRNQAGTELNTEHVYFLSGGCVWGRELVKEQIAKVRSLQVETSGTAQRSDDNWVTPTSQDAFNTAKAAAQTNHSMWFELVQTNAGGGAISGEVYQFGIEIPVITIAAQMAESTSNPVKKLFNIFTKGSEEADTEEQPTLAPNASDAKQSKLDETSDLDVGAADPLSLWRLATNLVRDYAQKKHYVAAYKAGTNIHVNPAAIVATLISSAMSKTNAVRLYMFNPQFGPIAICVEPIPQDADYGFAPGIMADASKVGRGGSVDAITPAMGVFQLQGSDNYRLDQRNSYQDTQWSSHLWRWAVKGFAFQQAKMVNGRPQVQEGDAVHFNDEIAMRWPLTMYAQLVVTYAGSGDISFFDNQAAQKISPDTIEASTTSPTTVNGLIFVPAKLLTKPLKAGVEAATGPDRTKETYVEKQMQAAYKTSTGYTDRREKRKSKSRNNAKRKERGGKKDMTDSNPYIEPVGKGGKDVRTTTELIANDKGPLDSSSNASDRDAKTRMSKPARATPLIL